MTKDDALDLIVKAFGVGLLVAAISMIPTMVESVMMANTFESHESTGDGEQLLSDYWSLVRSGQVSSGLIALLRFLLYLLVAVNFLRSGSLVRRLMGRGDAQAAADTERTR